MNQLPTNSHCSDCEHFTRCYWLICRKGHETECDWNPSRFMPRMVDDHMKHFKSQLNEQRQDSLEELSRIAYDLIRQSGLYREPRAKDWDQLADEWAVQLLAKADELDSEEWARIESEKERAA